MRLALKLLHFTWGLPMSLVGLAFFPGSKRMRDMRGGARLYYGGPLAQAFFRASGMGAITLGAFVFSRNSFISLSMEKHEQRHVYQQLILGWLFPVAYYVPMLWLLAMGRNPYWDTPLEVDARRHER